MASHPTQAQQQILTLLALVPYGKVVSYGQLADLAGLPGRARLVGSTLRTQNTEQLPWHRVVAADGRPGLPKGSSGWREQRQRLLAEGVFFTGDPLTGDRVAMAKYQWQPDLAAMLMLFER